MTTAQCKAARRRLRNRFRNGRRVSVAEALARARRLAEREQGRKKKG